jgi:hypothetical protein
MNDNEGEISEELRELVEGVKDVMAVLQKQDDAHFALQILASAASCMLCSMVTQEKDVKEEFEMFTEAINRSVMLAKKNNMTAWIEGTPH